MKILILLIVYKEIVRGVILSPLINRGKIEKYLISTVLLIFNRKKDKKGINLGIVKRVLKAPQF